MRKRLIRAVVVFAVLAVVFFVWRRAGAGTAVSVTPTLHAEPYLLVKSPSPSPYPTGPGGQPGGTTVPGPIASP